MDDLASADFADYFRDIHSHDPFPWQARLTNEVLESGRWPDVIDLPTGTGKTAVLDTAVFALAVRPNDFPRRVVFVIDRRIVVDQVYRRAEQIESAIRHAATPVLQRVKRQLEAVSGDSPLGVAALRGGIPIDGEWALRPDQSWVMVSTVDQFGSRLLFRGYGVSPKMRPIHAGLAGNDCLVILDEVHLSRPFAKTLEEVQGVASQFASPLPQRFQVVEMSATPTKAQGRRFALTEADLAGSAVLRQRVHAAKSAELREAGSKPSHEAIPAEVKKILKSALDESVQSVGVIVNRVRTARETHRALVETGYDAHLVTGRMRPLDRVRYLSAIEDLVDPDRSSDGEGLTVVVSTQAIEVGADFSFDALITEVAPIDSLRQRFGRLDRRGTLAEPTGVPAKAWIIGVKSELNPKKPDPVYGDAARRTWDFLEQRSKTGPIDFTPWPKPEFPEGTDAPVLQAPLVLSTHMDAWVQTNPEPVVQPAIDWFLHGIEGKQVADVTVVWRHDRTIEALKEVPLRPAEYLQVPLGAARAWLAGAEEAPVADAGGEDTASRAVRTSGQEAGEDWCRWKGHDEDPELITPRDIDPGDVLIVAPERGGLSHGTWDPTSEEPVIDLGDEAQHAYGSRFTLRLDPRFVADLGLPSPPLPSSEETEEKSRDDRVREWLDDVGAQPGLPEWLDEVVNLLADKYVVKTLGDTDSHEFYYVLSSGRVDASTLDGSDQSASYTGSGVTLRKHLDGVGDRVADYASRLGMSDELLSDLHLAARLHDLGKVDSRFQRQMMGDDPVALAMQDEPLAKSLPGARPARQGWPPIRHEIMSTALAQSNPGVLADAHDPDLVLHLVETHHGYARPLPPIKEDPCPEVLKFDHDGLVMEAGTDLVDGPLALEMADRFWRLVERYGYHGLAWLEAILRLADHQQSAQEATQ